MIATHNITYPHLEIHKRIPTSANRRGKESAFSLVELSIVLVILGLLTGGILGGQSLIRAAELRAVTTEYNRYVAAVNTFKDKYFAIPGDMSNATQFWGRLNTDTTCVTNSSSAVSATGTCDGDGNGLMFDASGAGKSGERFQFWRQLALAGLIEGSYTGLAGPASWFSVTGTNEPKSRLSNAGWFDWYGSVVAAGVADHTVYAGDYGNLLLIGLNVLKPEEAWNIDTKMDDGKPGTGKIWAREGGLFTSPATSAQCTTSTSNTDYAGNYNLSNSSINCGLYFPKVF